MWKTGKRIEDPPTNNLVFTKFHVNVVKSTLERQAVPWPPGSRNTKPMADVTKGRCQQSSTMPIQMDTEFCGMKANYSPPSNTGMIHVESEKLWRSPCTTLSHRILVSSLATSGSPHSTKTSTLCVANRDKHSSVQPTVTHCSTWHTGYAN